jgi:hypothetical protein
MMSQSWLGSDFSNDDLAKSDQILEDYDHTIIASEYLEDHTMYTIESIARETAPVVWGKQVLQVRDDYILLRQQFYDEDMVLVKEMVSEDLVQFSDRLFPRLWTMRSVDKEDRFTLLEYLELSFNEELEDRLFTLASLKSRRR